MDDALFDVPDCTETGAVERALNAAASHDPHAQRYPAAVELARVIARGLDRAEAGKNAASGIANLGKTYLMVLAPLGLAPALDSHPGDPVAENGVGDGDPFSGYAGPTLVHEASA